MSGLTEQKVKKAAYDRERREHMVDVLNELQRARYAAHKARESARRRKYFGANKAAVAAGKRRWRKDNPHRVTAQVQRRRARRRGAFVEDVSILILFVRDVGVCQLCGCPVSERSGPEGPSVDHILPLARGGVHSYANTQLAHHGCNARKRDNILTGA